MSLPPQSDTELQHSPEAQQILPSQYPEEQSQLFVQVEPFAAPTTQLPVAILQTAPFVQCELSVQVVRQLSAGVPAPQFQVPDAT